MNIFPGPLKKEMNHQTKEILIEELENLRNRIPRFDNEIGEWARPNAQWAQIDAAIQNRIAELKNPSIPPNQTDPLDDQIKEILEYNFDSDGYDNSLDWYTDLDAAVVALKAAINAEIAKAVREATNFSKVNRVEVINHTQSPEYGGGRTVVKWAKKPLDVQISMQDDYRTLKLFVKFKEDGE